MMRLLELPLEIISLLSKWYYRFAFVSIVLGFKSESVKLFQVTSQIHTEWLSPFAMYKDCGDRSRQVAVSSQNCRSFGLIGDCFTYCSFFPLVTRLFFVFSTPRWGHCTKSVLWFSRSCAWVPLVPLSDTSPPCFFSSWHSHLQCRSYSNYAGN
jgi:hypothetical protein